MSTLNRFTFWFSTSFLVVCLYGESAYSHTIGEERAKLAYRELELANRKFLTLDEYGDGRETPFAMNATHSGDIQDVFTNLLQSVLSTRDPASSLKLTKTPYPILIVLVNFADEVVEWDEETYQDIAFGEGESIKTFWDQNLHGAVEITPASTTSGTTAGVITVEYDGTRPVFKADTTDEEDTGVNVSDWIKENLESYVSEYVDSVALDADFNGWLTQKELTIHFVLAGPYLRGFMNGAYFHEPWALKINGINLHGWAVTSEDKDLADDGWSTEAQEGALRGTFIHEFGHLFGTTDKYFNDGGNPFGYWSVMDGARFYDNTKNRISSPNAMVLDKLETGLLESAEISEGGSVPISAITDTRAPLRKLKEAKRVWLDPYKVRSSVLLEHRSGSGYDTLMDNTGLIAVAVESLAKSSAFDDPEISYRKGAPIDGTGAANSQGVGDLIDLSAREDTPGYVPDPTWSATQGSIFVDSVGTDSAEISVDLQSYGPKRGHIRYDKTGIATENSEDSDLLVANFGGSGWGDGYDGVQAATLFTNTTALNQIDGFEIFLRDPSSEVTVEIYEDVVDRVPFNLLSTEVFSFEEEGWNRGFLSNPVAFTPNTKLLFSASIRMPDGGAAWYARRPAFDLSSSVFNREEVVQTFVRPLKEGITYSFLAKEGEPLGHILLMSEQ